MFKASELGLIFHSTALKNSLEALRTKFTVRESSALNIDSPTFMALVLLTPAVDVALANGSINLFEEVRLHKKARALTPESLLQRNDSVVASLKILVQEFGKWKNDFYVLCKQAVMSSLKSNAAVWKAITDYEAMSGEPIEDLLRAPYILVKILSLMFLESEDDFLVEKRIPAIEIDKIGEIGKILGLDESPLFGYFLQSFSAKESV